MTFSFKHESRNGEWTALPGRRASVEGELGERRIRRHHGERNFHVSLECLRGTAPLIDLLVPQGHLCPIGSSSSLGSPPQRVGHQLSSRRMRLDSGNRLGFAERTDCVDICLCQNRLRNEMRAVRRRLRGAGGCLGSWSGLSSSRSWSD